MDASLSPPRESASLPAETSASSTPAPLPAAASTDVTPSAELEQPVAGPSTTPVPAPVRRIARKPQRPDNHDAVAGTTAFVPGIYNVKNPAGDFLQKETNSDVVRQVSQARARRAKEDESNERKRKEAAGEAVPDLLNPLSSILIIHPGSRNLRFGRASDFYPREVPNCIARPKSASTRGRDPPVPGARATNGHANGTEAEANGHGMELDGPEEDPVEAKIGYLRGYLKNLLIQNKLATDWRDATRVVAANSKVRPEGLPEHNDPYRIDWTEVEDKKCFIGTEALRLAPSSNFRVRWPILNRKLNTRDWDSQNLLMDDFAFILQESLRAELNVTPRMYQDYAVVLIVPDHGDKAYVQEMTHLILGVMGFKEVAVHQEAYAAIFSAGMSTACVVDIGSNVTSVSCVDEGVLVADTRINLGYGGDDITTALAAILAKSSFPYRDLNLARNQDWIMMDNLKIKICTLEEQLVASTPWDFYVLQPEGLTQKYIFRTYDENILAPLVLFDTRMIDFDGKKGEGAYPAHVVSDDIDDMLQSSYGDVTNAMKACTTHLQPIKPIDPEAISSTMGNVENGTETPNESVPPETKPDEVKLGADTSRAPTPVPVAANGSDGVDEYDIAEEASRIPLDAAIAASIATLGSENKAKAAASAILLIGGSTALKGLNAFLAERLPPLLRVKGVPVQDALIVPPPRGLNPRFVSWKGACVMCNLESMSDMWIRRDEWDAIGARALKDRYLFF